VNKLKHRIETWLKRLIAEEVEKIDRDLRGERAALRAQIATFDGAFKAQLQFFNDSVKCLSEVQENLALREHIKELHAQITTIHDLFKKLHPVT